MGAQSRMLIWQMEMEDKSKQDFKELHLTRKHIFIVSFKLDKMVLWPRISDTKINFLMSSKRIRNTLGHNMENVLNKYSVLLHSKYNLYRDLVPT